MRYEVRKIMDKYKITKTTINLVCCDEIWEKAQIEVIKSIEDSYKNKNKSDIMFNNCIDYWITKPYKLKKNERSN